MDVTDKPVILIVDDDKEDRIRLGRYLRLDGYEVLEAVGGSEALAIAENPSTRIDLLITDVRMPLLNGWELSKRINALRPDLKVLFASGYSLEILKLLKICVERSSLIHKSLDRGIFLSVVRRFLNIQSQGDPAYSP
ncbi:MAG TPA: response regulator [Fibrobacteria bacterium]|nr:response regulator [Fibrobacteria bacterium]